VLGRGPTLLKVCGDCYRRATSDPRFVALKAAHAAAFALASGVAIEEITGALGRRVEADS
jgi:hypothetical protein